MTSNVDLVDHAYPVPYMVDTYNISQMDAITAREEVITYLTVQCGHMPLDERGIAAMAFMHGWLSAKFPHHRDYVRLDGV